ncbi:hypothetical protein [Stenotrophomonas maltophilia]|uniref:hypothetical protein n=1 Tax=Stenotrophomonas maltophilia TaxID=40324 RepID=UPI0039C27507
MDKTFELELVRVSGDASKYCVASVDVRNGIVRLSFLTDSAYSVWTLLPSEAVTIGEQLIAAGKAGE